MGAVRVGNAAYSKGLEERFLGYERFLTEHSEERKEVVLLQIAPPSRGSVESYQQIRSTLEGLAGRINGAHAGLDWVPIRYVNQGYPRDALAGVYRASRIGLVTPLRGRGRTDERCLAGQSPQPRRNLRCDRPGAGNAAGRTHPALGKPHGGCGAGRRDVVARTFRRCASANTGCCRPTPIPKAPHEVGTEWHIDSSRTRNSDREGHASIA